MRTNFPKAKDTDSLVKVQGMMQTGGIRAVPVVRATISPALYARGHRPGIRYDIAENLS